MAAEMDWEERTQRARAALSALDFLLGEWDGVGTSHGAPVRARLNARRSMDGTFVEARELLLDEAGAVDHEDLSLYRYDADEDRVRVSHFMAPSWVVERFVLSMPDGPGVRWYAGPFSPRVELTPDGDALLARIFLPREETPAVHLRYTRR